MKKLPILLFFCFALFTIAKSQTPPNAFNYSAVARSAAGQPIVTTTIGIQISILKTSATGTSQYSENHFVNTDAFGLFNLVIGAGAIQSGSMASIDWSNDNYYLKVGMDATGGTNFLTMGTTQLLSVPYALHSKTAESIIGGGSSGNFNHFIGEEFGGGVIFHLWKDAQGVEHGLIVDKVDLSTSQAWSNLDITLIGTSAQSAWDGLSNSNAIVTQPGHTNSAAAISLNSTNGGQSDWYLPSIQELNLLWNNYQTIARSFMQISGATQVSPDAYWSSTEADNDYSVYFDFSYGASEGNSKTSVQSVRAIRAF
jgi:hypothetical protein